MKVVDATEVPTWERRAPKWNDLVDMALSLEPNTSLEVFFDDPKDAERARNAVRDQANLRARTIVLRTRIVVKPDKSGAIVYLTRVGPAEAGETQTE
jgi:hypothetical protein